jgi:FkbM family methyltransferase
VAQNGLDQLVVAHRMAVHPVWRKVVVTSLPCRARAGTATRANSGRVVVAESPSAAGVAAAPLDEILDGIRGVGIVKVDAQGSSAEILASGRDMLLRDRPLVAAEAASPVARDALRALLAPLGYREFERRYCWTATWLWEPCRPG